jgi:hypothetical protein
MSIVAIVENVTSVTNKDDKVDRIESDSTQDGVQTGGFFSDSQAVVRTHIAQVLRTTHYANCGGWAKKVQLQFDKLQTPDKIFQPDRSKMAP